MLTDTQRQCLKKIIRDCRSSIGPWLEGTLDSDSENVDRLDSTLSKLEDIYEDYPSSRDVKRLLGEFLHDLSYVKGRKYFPERHKRAVEELRQSIELPSLPSLLSMFLDGLQLPINMINWVMDVSRAPVDNVKLGLVKFTKFATELVDQTFPKPPQISRDKGFPLLSALLEIDRKGDFYDNVELDALKDTSGFAARILCVMNVLKSFMDMSPPDRIGFPSGPGKRQPVVSQSPPFELLSRESVSIPAKLFEQLGHLALKVDDVFTQTIQGATGWRPVAAVTNNELNKLIKSFLQVNVKKPFATVPSSSYGAVGSPYEDTVEQLDPSALEKVCVVLAQWLQTTSGYLAAAGVATFNSASVAARQHPRAAATLTMAMIYAVYDKLHSLLSGESMRNNGTHFVEEDDPVLRKYISDEVGAILSEMPDVVQAIEARLQTSSYADPHRDPLLIPDIKLLLSEPVLSQPDQSVAELIDESILKSRNRYAHLLISRLEADQNENPVNEVEDLPANSERQKLADDSAQWVLEALSDAELTRQADRNLQTRLLEKLEANQNIPLSVPKDSSMSKPLELYQNTLNDPRVLAWLTSKGFVLDTLIIHESSISGTVVQDGASSTQTFSLWDTSGWWQVSAHVLAARRVLDPGNFGLPFVDEQHNLVPCDVILDFYKVMPPITDGQAAALATQLKIDGWPDITAEYRAQINKECDEATALIAETKSRAQLIHELTAASANLLDDTPLSLSGRYTRSGNHLPLTEKCADIVEDLNAFLKNPKMVEICKDANVDCDYLPVRICDKKIQVLISLEWKDLTGLVQAQSALTGPFDDLLKKVEQTGNALYSTLSIDLQQVINYKGFGSPKTAGEIRNVIQWMNTTLPSAPPLGDYSANLLGDSQSLIKLTPDDRASIISLQKSFFNGASSIIDELGAELLPDTSVEYRRSHVDELLGKMFEADQCVSWGHQLLQALNWYGAGQTAFPEHYQSLLLAAIKLAVDPDVPGRPGTVAGYDVYQPKNLGRDLVTVRTEIEQHLIDHRGVSAQAAPLIAHLFLADAAPEFLAQDPDKGILVGTASWMTLRLGVAIAELQRPGCSRAMTTDQLMALALLNPTTPEQRLLFKSAAVDILMTWGAMNGVVQPKEAHSVADYSLVAKRFATQRAELSEAVEGFKQPLLTRREIAIQELGKAFSFFTTQAVEEIKIKADVFEPLDKLNPVRTVEKTLVEAYMDGDLFRHRWKMSSDPIDQGVFDRCVFILPVLNDLLSASVNRFFNSRRNAFVTSTKSLIAALPLEDRQCLEQGEVQLFTLREETGKPKEDETAQIQAVNRGRQGTLLRCKYQQKVSYFEVFPGRLAIIKRVDLPDDLPLNGVIKIEKAKISKGSTVNVQVQRGTELPFDFAAYFEGSEPIAGARSPKLIVEKLGNTLPAVSEQGSKHTTLVPDSYGSGRTAAIVDNIINGNYLQGERDFLFKQAKGQTTAEENRAYWEKIGNFLLQLIPFVGCTDDLQSGDRMRFINGAFGCFTDLASGLNTLVGGAGRITKALSSIVPVSIKAFEAIKITGTTLISLINPLDGLPDLIAGGARTVGSLRKILTSGVFALTDSGVGHLQVCLDRLRAFFGGAASGAATRLPRSIAGTMGQVNGSDVAWVDNKWYALDIDGNPIGRALDEPRVQRA
ncbi:hypothetical protein DKY63_05215 [Pseudomonas putida]|uniref:Uncharacterized protein n=1 Tax=Pseudomonas putida TaxID=303 RepID=A0A2Z4REU9_PSEPU|nr:hypothetical protein [Pseudomonas putida]AWY39335.1 hypothetical protein DKY63_05215 [Pseudomonas putida]